MNVNQFEWNLIVVYNFTRRICAENFIQIGSQLLGLLGHVHDQNCSQPSAAAKVFFSQYRNRTLIQK